MLKVIKKIKENKVLNILYSIVKTIITIILLCILLVVIVQKVTKNNLAIGGVRVFAIISDSMAPEYEIGDILVSYKTDIEEIKVGDNVTYYGEEGDMKNKVVTHKVLSIREENGSHYFITKGLANDIEDPEINESQIYGKVIYKTYFFSYLCKVMNNIYAYYALFIIVGIMVSYQIVKIIFEEREDDDDDSEQEKDNLESTEKTTKD